MLAQLLQTPIGESENFVKTVVVALNSVKKGNQKPEGKNAYRLKMLIALISDVYFSRAAGSVRRGVLSMCDVRLLHGRLAGAGLRVGFASTHVHHSFDHAGPHVRQNVLHYCK